MTRKSNKIAKKVWKKVSIEDAKVKNVDYRFHPVGYRGFFKPEGSDALVSVIVSSVSVDLRNGIVTSVLEDSQKKRYFCKDSYKLYNNVKGYEDNACGVPASWSAGELLRYADYGVRNCERYVIVDNVLPNGEKESSIYLSVWIFENGDAVEVPVLINTIETSIDTPWHLVDGSLPDRYWQTREEAFSYNEYKVVDEDGEEFVEQGINMRLMPTKEQQGLLDNLRAAFKAAYDAGLSFVWDRDRCDNIKVYNRTNVEDFGYDVEAVRNGDLVNVEGANLVDTGIRFYDYCGCDGDTNFAMRPTPRQEKKWMKNHPQK